MSRTTLDLDPSVIRELRHRAQQEHKSMGEVASQLLAAAMAGPSHSEEARAFKWTSANLGLPRVDLEDKEALQRVLNQGDEHNG